MITFHDDRRPDGDAIRALFAAAPLRRPIHHPARIAAMFASANLVITAYDEERLVGVLRGWTDFVYDGYICDLAVHPDYQKSAGIGRGLLDLAMGIHEGIHWVLQAAPLAKDYYAHLGWTPIHNGWERLRQGWTPGDYETFIAEHAELARQA
ncbi:MAG TPA: GNAT family N-acetyltransferase [Holophagaceae bacterium]|nr:GNAT family N-acetyltransferase [Holophagaceae bacterium]